MTDEKPKPTLDDFAKVRIAAGDHRVAVAYGTVLDLRMELALAEKDCWTQIRASLIDDIEFGIFSDG